MITYKDISINEELCSVRKDDRLVHLTKTQYRLFLILLEHAGQISRKVAESIAARQLDAYKGRLREEERRASLAELEADLQAAAKKQS